MIAAAPPAISSHLLVSQDGAGDFTSLTAALANWNANHSTDSILIAPGEYDEVVNLDFQLECPVASTEGPEVTQIRGFTALPEGQLTYEYAYGGLYGISIKDPVKFGNNTWYANWTHCIFEGGFHGHVFDGSGANFGSCTFRDTSSFDGYAYYISDCVFEGAPSFFRNALGAVEWQRCTFKGPARALATIEPRDESQIVFEDCAFSDADQGVVVEPRSYFQQMAVVDGCRFDRIAGAAMFYEYGDWKQSEFAELMITIQNSRIADCGQAIHTYAPGPIHLACSADTILRCAGNAIEGTVQQGDLGGVLINGTGGDGIHWILQSQQTSPWTYFSSHLVINSRISGCGGNGVTILERSDAPIEVDENLALRNSTIENNYNTGLWIESAAPNVTGCLLRRNGDDGLHVVLAGDAPTCSLGVNTMVENGRDGLVIESQRQPTGITVANNLLSENAGAGIRMLANYVGDASRNDAWLNHGDPFVGIHAGDTELESDPLFCAASAGDFELRANSPCAPSGAHGQIGAFAVGCGALASIPIESASRSLRLAPNPARGNVTFAWAPNAAVEALEVLDVQGRVEWRAPAPQLATGSVHWDGHDSSGRSLSAGIYFARWKAGGESRAARLVWLGD